MRREGRSECVGREEGGGRSDREAKGKRKTGLSIQKEKKGKKGPFLRKMEKGKTSLKVEYGREEGRNR